MLYETNQIRLRNGKTALLRSPRTEDAAEMLEYLKTTAAETHFLLRTPEECTATVQQEAAFLQDILNSDNTVMIVCEVDGRIAGNCQVSFKTKIRNRHRGMIGIALLKEFWGLGIGTAMLEELIRISKDRGGISQLELEVVEGNSRAMSLYEKLGFVTVAEKPNAIRLTDGTMLKELYMIRML